jgi:hypothetical protein
MPIVQCQFVTLPRSVLNGDIAMCRFFTQLGVDVHATNNRGATPAEIGKSRHSAEVAAALGAPPMPAAPTLYVPHLPPLYFCNILRRYSKGSKCLTIEWPPIAHVDSAQFMFEVSTEDHHDRPAALTHSLAQVQCCTDDGVWRLVARSVRGNTVKVHPPAAPSLYTLILHTCARGIAGLIHFFSPRWLSDPEFGRGKIVQISFALLFQL